MIARPALLTALAAAFLALPASPASAGEAPAPVPWEEMRVRMSGLLRVAQNPEDRWILRLAPQRPPAGAEAAAWEALEAGRRHVAWVASTILQADPPQLPPTAELPAPLPDPSAAALFREPAFEEPLRRFASAALSARGIPCEGCLEALPPSREIRWEDLRKYLAAFIFVREVSDDGKIDLRVGTLASSLPPPEECDLALAAAAHSIMRETAMSEAVLQPLVSRALQADLERMGSFPADVLERKLNESTPLRVLTDPLAMRPILLRALDQLDLHGLRCSDCARRLPRGGR